MYKFHSFTFKELDVENHWVAFPSFGELLTSSGGFADNDRGVKVHLSPNEVYQVSTDQSTTNTGIFIKNYRNTEAHLIEVSRDRGESAEEFIRKLEYFLHSLFEGQVLSHVIYEKPIKARSFRSSQVLFQLEGMLIALPYRYPEFKTAKFDCIENASWRSVVVDKGRTDIARKELTRVSVQQIWEWTRDYGYSLGNDEDIYEAFGIMMGWFYKAFDPLGRPYVRGEPTRSRLGAFVFPATSGEDAVAMLKAEGIHAEMMVANPDNSIYRNLAVMVEHYHVLCIEFSTPYAMLAICVESNLIWANYEKLTVVLTNAHHVDAKLRELSGGEFHFVV